MFDNAPAGIKFVTGIRATEVRVDTGFRNQRWRGYFCAASLEFAICLSLPDLCSAIGLTCSARLRLCYRRTLLHAQWCHGFIVVLDRLRSKLRSFGLHWKSVTPRLLGMLPLSQQAAAVQPSRLSTLFQSIRRQIDFSSSDMLNLGASLVRTCLPKLVGPFHFTWVVRVPLRSVTCCRFRLRSLLRRRFACIR